MAESNWKELSISQDRKAVLSYRILQEKEETFRS
jgi:hypothetical protein